jgi:simple sugar transport system ATP-binding protein
LSSASAFERPADATPALSLAGITKRFGSFAANDAISLDLAKGEIVALLGENGAGKTTLMNILFGHYTPDEGTVCVDGRRLPPGRPRAAIEAGIGMVHQHFTLAANLTVLENVAAGTQSLLSLRLDEARVRRRLAELSDRFGLAIDPDRRVGELSVGEQQRTEILKALYGDTRILVLDEPTAVLTPAEAEGLFSTLRRMADMGLSVIFISHKLHEVLSAADRVVVLRGGRLVGERLALEAKGLGFVRDGRAVVSDASFTLREGEILGLIGVSGNGQSDLARLLFGQERPSAGKLTLFGREVTHEDPRARIAAGLGRIPEDRNRDGAVGDMSLWENAVLERVREPRFSRLGLVRRTAARAFARHVAETFDVRGGTPDTRIRLLSGGNVQKLILGRTLDPGPKVIVAAQPTRGLDEGAVAAVHAALLRARAAGAAILLVSEDLDEVLQLADRTMAIHAGRLSDAVPTDGLDARRLGLMIAGERATSVLAAEAPA